MNNMIDLNAPLEQHLVETFGFLAFREGQHEAIQALFEHKRLLCILPTGHGKSLLYQLPAKTLPGITIVISPLLALVRDQLSHLNERFNIPAAAINSDQSDEENFQAQRQAIQGDIKILFVAPEQLDNLDRFEFLLNLPVSLIVVDEAHCISTWGHDFRPSYRQIIQLVRALEEKYSDLHVLGLTATADHRTEDDIKKQLAETGREVVVHRASLDRPNLRLSVMSCESLSAKLFVIESLVAQLGGCGLIYCATREHTLLVDSYLKSKQINSAAYHAGFPANEKREIQKKFIAGDYKVIAATNALGMGIDKTDLRFILHFDVPGSITAYYQEVGRAGRDGKTAYGILLFNPADKNVQMHFIRSAQPNKEHFDLILATIVNADPLLRITDIKCQTGLHPTLVLVVLAELIEQGYIEKIKQNNRQVYHVVSQEGSPNLERYENQYQVKMRELRAMLRYGEMDDCCLMRALRLSLSDEDAQSCGHCSVCLGKPEYTLAMDSERRDVIEAWLNFRVLPIAFVGIKEGVALLDGAEHSKLFVDFMRQRPESSDKDLGLSKELMVLIKDQLMRLHEQHHFTHIVSIPSRSWGAREVIVNRLAAKFGLIALNDGLQWQAEPDARQGELLNNDQRRENVKNNMTWNRAVEKPSGAILLLDDYNGSNATLREAVRVLRKQAGLQNTIVPLTIASVKWKLGKSGMV